MGGQVQQVDSLQTRRRSWPAERYSCMFRLTSCALSCNFTVADVSSRALLKSRGLTETEEKRDLCLVGAGNKKRRTFTRYAQLPLICLHGLVESVSSWQIQQTPDLASLDPEHLPEETLNALPYLRRLRSALYSQDFRDYIRKVTGCGPLSGKKTDASVGLYSKGLVPFPALTKAKKKHRAHYR